MFLSFNDWLINCKHHSCRSSSLLYFAVKYTMWTSLCFRVVSSRVVPNTLHKGEWTVLFRRWSSAYFCGRRFAASCWRQAVRIVKLVYICHKFLLKCSKYKTVYRAQSWGWGEMPGKFKYTVSKHKHKKQTKWLGYWIQNRWHGGFINQSVPFQGYIYSFSFQQKQICWQ